MILNFLAAEGRLSTQHIDCIWAAAQVKRETRYSFIPLHHGAACRVKHESYRVTGAGISVLVDFSVSEALGTKLLKTRGVYATKWFMHLTGTLL